MMTWKILIRDLWIRRKKLYFKQCIFLIKVHLLFLNLLKFSNFCFDTATSDFCAIITILSQIHCHSTISLGPMPIVDEQY